MTKIIAAMTARASSTPTMPAIAPPLIPFFFFFDGEARVDVESGTEVGDADTKEVDSALDVALPIEVAIVEATELDAEVNDLPSTCASLTTFTPLLQQSRLVPQHHVSLSAFPVQGVICAFPPVWRDEAQISRHFPLE
jgi:hypothetical protein